MNDKELAKRVVALGVGSHDPNDSAYYWFKLATFDARRFVNDGRVVLALMEKCSHIDAYWDDTGWSCDVVGAFHNRKLGSHDGMVSRSSIAVAIIEACCNALEQANEQ